MLRSIFSLIQNIIDFDSKEFNNKQSKTVIHLVSNPEHTFNMDLDTKEDPMKNKKAEKLRITNEHGDTLRVKAKEESVSEEKERASDEVKGEKVEKTEVPKGRVTFSNDENVTVDEKEYGDVSVKELIKKCSENCVRLENDNDQITALMEQITKMKSGIERLQEIAQQFKSSESFKQDIDYLLKNLPQDDSKDDNMSPTKM